MLMHACNPSPHDRDRRIRNSRLSSATQQVPGQPGVHEILETCVCFFTSYNFIFGCLWILTKKSPGPGTFSTKFFQLLKEEEISILVKVFRQIRWKWILPNSFYETSITLILKLDNGTQWRITIIQFVLWMQKQKFSTKCWVTE